ncbi:MAG: shikimate dehydrogenase [Lysobacterales bacterium]|jgi:shikimate dehydrogenase
MNSNKTIYGIIGNPLKHTLSPVMHNTAFKALGVDAEYKAFPLQEDELDDFFKKLKSPDSPIFGLNVTVPYKEKVLKYMDTLTPLVEKLKAVNTIVISRDRKLVGYNTDAPGFLTHLTELGFDFSDKRVAIMGAGGSARAILTTLCLIPERPKSITIYNRTSSRLDTMLSEISEYIDISIVETAMSIDDLNIELADLLINTTSLGLREDDPVLVEEELLHSNMLVYDLIYNPAKTTLLQMAEARGARVSNGLGMLFYQGVLALQHWAEDVDITEKIKMDMREALEDAA